MDQYVITDGARYISKNKNNVYVPDYDISKALVTSKANAEKIFYNSLAKPLRKVFRLAKRELPMIENQEIKDGKLKEVATEKVSIPEKIDEIKVDAPKETVSTKYTKHQDTHCGFNPEMTGEITKMVSMFKFAPAKKVELTDHLNRVEREIVDIYHYIEFKSLNACDGYVAYKMLRDRLVARRKIKNELKVAEILAKGVFTTADIVEIENIIESFDKNKYRPRALNGLFT